MAKPRIFVSSTYYDLKHLRASLEAFIHGLGFDAILSEKGAIAYSPEVPLDESCYREVGGADIFVMMIGGRYGTEKSNSRSIPPKDFYTRYDSITKEEYRTAVDHDIPIYVLIERSVYSDYETYLRNKDNSSINYAHVDSINICQLIEEILAQPRNNPIQQFDRYEDIEHWLRDQWAGLFRELLTRMSGQRQLASLAAQVKNLSEINTTLKTYLEQLVSKIAPDEAGALIQKETKRLGKAIQLSAISENPFLQYLRVHYKIDPEELREPLLDATTTENFFERLVEATHNQQLNDDWRQLYFDTVTESLNTVRAKLALPPLTFDIDKATLKETSTRTKAKPTARKKSVATKRPRTKPSSGVK